MRRGGFFVSVEGGDKTGKTTQAALLVQELRTLGYAVVLTREPGGTPAGEAIRDVLLARREGALTPVTEALLFAASRGQLVAEVVRPALENGQVVVADRYVDSSLAYQAFGLGLPFERVLEVNEWATGALWPDLTILLDCDDMETVWARPREGESDRIEEREAAFHRRVAEGYRELARRYPERYVTVDAGRPVAEVAEAVRSIVLGRLSRQQVATERRCPGNEADRGRGAGQGCA